MGRNIFLIGIGQTGCKVAELFAKAMNKGRHTCKVLAFDTDKDFLAGLSHVDTITLTDNGDLNRVVENLGEDNIKSWFPCDWDKDRSEFIKHLDMQNGSNQWRMKALLSFASFRADKKRTAVLDSFLEDAAESAELYVVASLAGGTGSSLLLPVTLYFKDLLKKRGTDISYSCGVLALPDIFESCYSSEQRVKADANAYSALRELNAVNMVTTTQDLERLPDINFKILNENEHFNAVYDTANPATRTPEYTPFDQIYLFNRVPGIFSADAHIGILCETLVSICKDPITEQRDSIIQPTTSVFGGISMTKVKYPTDSIVTYISKRQLGRFVSEELGGLLGAAKAEADRMILNARTYGVRNPDFLTLYCESVVRTSEEKVSSSGSPEALLGRAYADGVGSGDSGDILGSGLFENVREAVYDSLNAVGGKEYSLDAIRKEAYPTPVPGQKRGPGLRELFPGVIASSRKLLKLKYASGMENAAIIDDNTADIAINGELTGEKMLYETIFKENGEFLHPTYALVRMCRLYADLNAVIFRDELLPQIYDPKRGMPDEFMTVEAIRKPKTKYAKLGGKRFFVIMDSEDSADLPKYENAAAADDVLYFDDLENVHGKLMRSLANRRYLTIADMLGRMILSYRKILESLCRLQDDISVDIKLAAISASTDSNTAVYVGASVAEKEALFDGYTDEYSKDPLKIFEIDSAIGEDVHSLLSSENAEEQNARSLAGRTEEMFRRCLLESEFYSKHIDKNIIEAISAMIGSETYSRIFVGKNIPLLMNGKLDYSDRRKVLTVVHALLPDAIREPLSRSGMLDNGETPEAYVERLMYTAGEYHGRAFFTDGLNERELLVRKSVTRLPLYSADFANDSNELSPGYLAYKKAHRVSRAQITPLWNPHLTYSRGNDYLLPFISPVKQSEFVSASVKALICGKMNRTLRSGEGSDGAEVWFSNNGIDLLPIEDAAGEIPVGETKRLLDYFYSHTELTWENAERLDRIMSSAIRTMRYEAASCLDSASESTEAYANLSAIWDNGCSILLGLLSERATNGCGYFEHTARLMLDTMFDNTADLRRNDERALELQREKFMAALRERLEAVCSPDTAEILLSAVASKYSEIRPN